MSKKILIIEVETGEVMTDEEIKEWLNKGSYCSWSYVNIIAELPKFNA